MIINFTNYYDQTQVIGLGEVLSYSGYYFPTPYPLLILLSKSVEFGISLSKSVEYSVVLSKSGGGATV